MGFHVNIEGDFRNVDLAQLQPYLKQIVQEATGEPISHVIQHNAVRQTPEQALRELQRLQRE